MRSCHTHGEELMAEARMCSEAAVSLGGGFQKQIDLQDWI